LHPARPSLVAAVTQGWLAGPLLFAVLVSPTVESAAEQSLVIHHFTHWLMVVAGALIGYQLRELVRIGHVRGIEEEIAQLAAQGGGAESLASELFKHLDRYDLASIGSALKGV